MIDAADWASIKSIFHAVVDAPAGERASLLDRLTRANPALKAEVEALLQADARTSGAFDELGASLMGPDDPMLGRTVGAYCIERELGQGGMGTVYLARRSDSFEQRVALKIVRRGMGTTHVLQRFVNERQILAGLTHPNIARLLDGGSTDDGRPYFVMEYLDGLPITEYCDTHQLSIDARLRLVLVVCDAVHYAHQRLVVHRDLKPSNILVTPQGVPKLLDFGIAKLLSRDEGEASPVTVTSMRVMTPEYAAPEQLDGGPITTATDVYALGLLLYELLTGEPARARHPLDAAAARSLRDEPAVDRPSARGDAHDRRAFRGDLDTIVLTATQRDPHRRYGSAEQLSEDVRRHLEGLPIAARPDTWRYRTGKFVRRNTLGVTAAAVVLIAVAGGSTAALWQGRIATRERRNAERRFNDVRTLAHALLFDINDEIDKGAVATRQLLVSRAMTYLDTLTREVGTDVDLQHELASAYQRLAQIQGTGLTVGQLGDARAATASYEKARALRDRIRGLAPRHFENRREQALLEIERGRAVLNDGDTRAGVDRLRAAATSLEALAAERPADRATREDLGEAYFALGTAYGSNAVAGFGDRTESFRMMQKGLPIVQRLFADEPSPNHNVLLASFHAQLASWYQLDGRLPDAIEANREAVRLHEALVTTHPDSLAYLRELAVGYTNGSAIAVAGRDYAGALEHALRAVPLFEKLVTGDPRNLNAKQDLAVGHRNAGRAYTLSGNPHRGRPHLQRALRLFEEILEVKPQDVFNRRQLAFTHLVASDGIASLDGPAAGVAEVQKGLPILQALVANDPKNATAWRTLAQSYAQAGEYTDRMAKAGARTRWRDAAGWYSKSRDAWQAMQQNAGSLAPADAKGLVAAEEHLKKSLAAASR